MFVTGPDMQKPPTQGSAWAAMWLDSATGQLDPISSGCRTSSKLCRNRGDKTGASGGNDVRGGTSGSNNTADGCCSGASQQRHR